jgi:hypothetical protein
MKDHMTTVERDSEFGPDDATGEASVLEQSDWDLILELLKTELSELPTEIHQTEGSRLHEELLERKEQVSGIVHCIEDLRNFMHRGHCICHSASD